MNNLYLKDGWLNTDYVIHLMIKHGLVFCFIVGGRGTGKTFGFLKFFKDAGKKIMLLRRTKAQLDIITIPDYNPYKPIDTSVSITSLGGSQKAFTMGDDIISLTGALSTFANLRSFDLSDIEYIYYDEFVPEKHERPLKFEYEALANMYETVNRNRELQGKNPVRLIATGNANNLANPIFIGLGVVNTVLRMKENEVEITIDKKRKLLLINLDKSPISQKKKGTALYIMDNTEYSNMAIENEFRHDETNVTGGENLKPYKPVVTVGEITVYKHKSKKLYYVSPHKSGTVITYSSTEGDLKRFNRKFYYLYDAHITGRVDFEDYLTKHLFECYIRY